MSKNQLPRPPIRVGRDTQCHVVGGDRVVHAWIFTDTGVGIIETQYWTAVHLQDRLGVSRATAYRIIAKQPVRYWVIDYRDEANPKCRCAIPATLAETITPNTVGNPNFRSGIYQQEIARRLRRKKR